MAVIVDVYQDKRKTGNNLWYGRAWHPGILDTRALSKRIEQNVSVKESDVYAVLIELANVMTYEIQNGNKCKLDRFGYFGVSLRSSRSGRASATSEFHSAHLVLSLRLTSLSRSTSRMRRSSSPQSTPRPPTWLLARLSSSLVPSALRATSSS